MGVETTHIRKDKEVRASLVADRDGTALYHAVWRDGHEKHPETGEMVPVYHYRHFATCSAERFHRDFAPC
jgi:hypothetical protein